jgi:hypothetical protein
MSVTAGEFFVNLGIKGAEKTVGAISSVRKGLNETASTSIETKAAIVGVMYAFERMFAASGAMGTGLTNFNSLLGVSTKTIQQYQYAARQMGVANEDTANTFRALQGLMSKTLMGEGAPKGLARVAALTGGISPQDILNFQKSPDLLIQKLQQYAQREKNLGLRNEVLKSFNLSDAMIAAMSRNAFSPSQLAKAPMYSENEIHALDRANIAWSNLGTKIEMAIGKFNAKHGGQLVKDISHITDEVLRLVEAFTRLAEKLKVFDWIGKIFQGWSLIFEGATTAVDKMGSAKGRTQLGGDIKDFFKEMPSVFGAMLDDISPETKDKFKQILYGDTPFYKPLPQGTAGAVTPRMPPAAGPSTSNTQNVNVNQTLNFSHDGKDHKQTGDSTKKAIQDFYRQNPAVGQGS